MRPTDVNGINKAAGEYYHLVYNNVFGVRACSLRLTNVYGPRQLIKHNRQGFIGWFIRLAIEDEDDPDLRRRLAAARLRLRRRRGRRVPARRARPTRATARCSTSAATSRSAIAISSTLLIEVAGAGRVRVRRVAGREEGDRHRQLLRRLDQVHARRPAGRRPSPLRDGLRRTIAFYREHFDHYVDARAGAGAIVSALRIPFMSLAPGEDAADVRARDRPRRSRAAGSSSARKSRRSSASSPPRRGAAHAVGVGTGTDAIALILRALGIGAGRRSDHDAAVGGLHRARDHDGRRAAGVRRHRSRAR